MKEVEAWTVAVGNFSMNPFRQRGYKEFFAWLKEQPGFYGVHPEPPHGTLILFATENNAKSARNLIRSEWKIQTGRNICKCFIPAESVKDVLR